MRHDAEQAERRVASTEPMDGLLGWAAGKDDAAQVAARADLELAERWLAGQWWAGRIPPQSLDDPAHTRLDPGITRQDHRQESAILLHAPGWPPVAAAWSAEPDGRGLCFGLAAGASIQSAVMRAWRELCQMEFALSLSRHRAAHGQATTHDRRVLERAATLNVEALSDRLTPQDNAALETAPPWPGELHRQTFRDGPHNVVRVRSPALNRPITTGWPLYV